jgi:hypothetical protein
MVESDFVRTRRALHGVAELIIAGPQYRRSGTIRLRARPGGFGAIAEPDVRVDGAELVAGAVRIPLRGTYRGLATAAGVDVGAPEGLYHDGSGASPDDSVDLDESAAEHLARCLTLGDEALRRVAPSATPVLWPEHFDIGVTLDEINLGVSLGDAWLGEPYVYVAPWRARTGDFWSAPFGAAVPVRERNTVDALAGFLTEGLDRARQDPVA